MANNRVSPNRMSLMRLKRELRTAARGHSMLKDKRDGLMKEFLAMVDGTLALRQEVDRLLADAALAMSMARAVMQPEMLDEAMLLSAEALCFEVSRKSVMAVDYPAFDSGAASGMGSGSGRRSPRSATGSRRLVPAVVGPLNVRLIRCRNGRVHLGTICATVIHIVRLESQALFLTGRLKSMIVLDNGKKVFPEELEALLHDELDESVKELLVYPQEDRSAIVLTLKCVVDKRADDAEIASHIAAAIERVNAQVPGFKRIKNFYFTHEELIKTSTMKVKRGPEMARIAAFLKEKGVEAKSLYGRNIDRI